MKGRGCRVHGKGREIPWLIWWSSVIVLIAGVTVFEPFEGTLGEQPQEGEVAGRKFINGAIAAMGGAAAFDQVRSISMLGMTRIVAGENEFHGSAKYVYMRPGKYRVDVDLQPLKMIQAFNGKVGWGMENMNPYPAAISQRIADSMQVVLTRGLLALFHVNAPKARMRIVAREELEGIKADVIDFEDGSGNSTRFFLGAESHLPLRAVYADIDPQGSPIETTDAFFNFRKTGPLYWPYRMVQYQAGLRKREDIFTEIQVNGKVSETYFDPVR
jgi:hypothetical protein